MADIRQYRRDKQKITKDESRHNDAEYDNRIRQHRIRMILIVAAAAVFVIVLVVVLMAVNYNSEYKSYAVRNTVIRNDSGYVEYMKFGSGYVRCSRDGIAMYSYGGEQQWNKTYEINSLLTDICGSYIAVAGIGGNEIYLFNNNGYISTVNTALPIVQISVSSGGMVVATLEDNKATYINMYDSEGDKIYNIKSTISGDGVPVRVEVSPDGHLLMVAFTSVKGQQLATSVVFYNFGEVGQSEVERVVAGYDTYGEQLVADVRFLGSKAAVAVGENVLSFFKVGEYPKLTTDVELDYTIRKVFYSDKYVGTEYLDNNNIHRINIYDASGNLVSELEPDSGYFEYLFAGDDLFMYGENEVRLVNMKGKVIYEDRFEDGIVDVISISDNNEYIVLSSDKIMCIELRHGG